MLPIYAHAVDSFIYPGIPYPTTANSALTDTTGFSPWPYDPTTHTYTAPAEWPSAASTGKYYIDNSGTCTDTANTYGYPANPRCTFPANATFSAGTIIEVHGGPYEIASLGYEFNCSSVSPCFIHTPDNAVIDITTTVQTHVFDVRNSDYLTIDGFVFDGIGLANPFPAKTPAVINGIGSTYLTFRNSTVQNIPDTAVCCSSITALGKNYTMSYNNTFTSIGVIPRTEDTGQQLHSYDYDQSHHWIIDNTVTSAGEDFVHVGPLNAGNETNRAKGIFIAGNNVNSTQENAVDIKRAQHVIISSNTFHNFKDGAPPNAIVVNNEDYSDQIWIINNIVYDSGGGISLQPVTEVVDIPSRIYAIGNTVYDCSSFGIGFAGSWGSTYCADIYLYNNTIDDSAIGLQLGNPGTGSTVNAGGNIVTNATTYELSATDDSSGTMVSLENIIYRDGGTASAHTDFPEGGHVTNDPIYLSRASRNYSISAESPAADGIASVYDVYATFQALYGMDIAKDIAGTTRPQNTLWDIGAYEYQPPRFQASLNGTGQSSLNGAGSLTIQY